MLMQLLQFPFTGDGGQALEEWERLVRQYEAQSSDTLQGLTSKVDACKCDNVMQYLSPSRSGRFLLMSCAGHRSPTRVLTRVNDRDISWFVCSTNKWFQPGPYRTSECSSLAQPQTFTKSMESTVGGNLCGKFSRG